MADSDSENEGILTNITRLVIRPPGHTGKAKKGHICFDGSHETMNMGRVDFITNQEYDIFMRPDTANPRSRFWFHFTVENTQKDQRVIFNVVNFCKSKTLFLEGLVKHYCPKVAFCSRENTRETFQTPVVKSTSRPRWQRMPTDHVFYYKSPLHKDKFVVSFAFCFDREDERYHFALAQPYSWSRYTTYLNDLIESNYNYLKVDVIAKTIQDRPLHLLTITHPSNLEEKAESNEKPDGEEEIQEGAKDHYDHEKDCEETPRSSTPSSSYDASKTEKPPKVPVVVLIARTNAAETPTSFIIQGFIDFLLSSHEIAEDLRSKVIIKVVPMMNPDGVFLGNTKGNLLGQDLNRHWHDAHPLLHPTIHAVKDLIHDLDSDPRLDLNVILDIHSHSTLLGLFAVGNSYDDVYRFERHIVFPKILSQNCNDFCQDNTIYNTDPQKFGCARRYFCDNLSPEVNSYTIEASLLGYECEEDPDLIIPYTEESYCTVGRNIVRAFWDFYKILGYIPLGDDDDDLILPPSMPKSAASGQMGAFNLLRLREIAHQRDKTAKTFEKGSDDEEDNSAQHGIRGQRIRTPSSAPGYRRRKKSCASSCSESSVSVATRLRLGASLDADFIGDDGDISEVSVCTSRGLSPIVQPAPKVKFKENVMDNQKNGVMRNQTCSSSSLSIVPTVSKAKPESPFASPSKKKSLERTVETSKGNEMGHQEVSLTLETKRHQEETKFSQRASNVTGGIIVSGIRAVDGQNQGKNKPLQLAANLTQDHVKKIGGGAVVSTLGSVKAPRPQGLRPTFHSEETTGGLKILDFSTMADRYSPKKKVKSKMKTKTKTS